jgi:hypothetical protein
LPLKTLRKQAAFTPRTTPYKSHQNQLLQGINRINFDPVISKVPNIFDFYRAGEKGLAIKFCIRIFKSEAKITKKFKVRVDKKAIVFGIFICEINVYL